LEGVLEHTPGRQYARFDSAGGRFPVVLAGIEPAAYRLGGGCSVR
jgi:hypothetical protein